MKITKRQLKKIVKEERIKVLSEMTSADRAIGLYFDVKHQQMAFDSLSVLFDESVADAITMDGYEEDEARQVVLEAIEQLFEKWLRNGGWL